jgi:hypothetical protein
MNRQIKRAVGTAAVLSLSLAGLVAVSAPAQAAVETKFKIHLNVPVEVAKEWNIWHWGTSVVAKDNTIGASTQLINDVSWTGDSTPNFVGEDAYGAYAEFTFPVSTTALNNVLRTTESWEGQDAAPAVDAVEAVEEIPAVLDDPATAEVNEAKPAVPAVEAKPAQPEKLAIPAADKPFGADNIFPAGESWWNVHTGKREYPAVTSYKVHVNMSLKTAQSQGWNLHSWNTTVAPSILQNYVVSTTKVVTSRVKVKGKFVTVKKNVVTKTNPYKGKVKADTTGWPFVGEDKYGAYAIVKTMGVYSDNAGLVLRRSQPDNDWAGVQSDDYKYGFDSEKNKTYNNGLPKSGVDMYLSIGSNEVTYSVPNFVGRYGATAAFSNGTLTVTPVRPAHPSMRGMFPSKIVVTAKRGANIRTCTIQNNVTQATFAGAAWGLPASCDMAIAAPVAGEGVDPQTWEIYVQAESVIGKGPGATDKPNAKVTIQPVPAP